MKQHRLMSRIAALAVGLAVAVSAMALASAQDPQEPPFRFYGHGANAGAVIGVHMNDDDLTPIDDTTVDENGSWYIDVDRDEADDVVFSIDGVVADSEVESTGSGQSSVTLTAKVMEEEDSMMDEGDDETMMEEDGEMSDDDSMMDEDDSMAEDTMEEDHDDAMADNGYPATGSGGLATDGGVSAGLVGLLIALGAAAIAGIGVRRVRNRV